MIQKKPISEEQAYLKMSSLCSVAEHCASEVAEKLRKMGIDSAISERIINRLTEERFLDESRYCRAYALDKMRYNSWGRTKIALMLQQKRLSRQCISEALDEIDGEEYEEILKHLIYTKLQHTTGNSEYERRGKVIRFAMSRGFEPRLIGQIIDMED